MKCEDCKHCKTMPLTIPCYAGQNYCHLFLSRQDELTHIGSCFVDPKERPEWCPVKNEGESDNKSLPG